MAYGDASTATAGGKPPILPMPKVTGAEDRDGAAIMMRFDAAKQIWDKWKVTWQDVYDLCLPQRQGFTFQNEGSRTTLDIYDETAVNGAQECASKIAGAMIPNFMRWIDLQAGAGVPEDARDQMNVALAEVTQHMFEILNRSNFNTQAVEAITEMLMSHGIMAMEDGDAGNPIRSTAVPLTQMVLARGPFGETDFWARPRKVKGGMIAVEWPKAKVSTELMEEIKQKPDAEIEFIEATYRDWAVKEIETYRWCVVHKAKKECITDGTFSGLGSCPWIDFSWARDAQETYGRGPLMNVLPAVKTANLTVQLTLENAEIAIAGMWQYDDDGVINPDNVQFVPGTMIPRDAGSKGLEPLTPPGNFNISNMVLQDMRENIKRGLYIGEFAPLGKTPQSATEVAYRQQDLAQRIGAAWGRLQHEFVTKCVQRAVYLLRRQGRITLPRVDGHLVTIIPVSPLAKAQKQEDIMAIDRYLEQIGQRFGPNIVPLVVNPIRSAKILSRLHGVPQEMNTTPEEIKQLTEQMAKAQAAQGANQPNPAAPAGQPATTPNGAPAA